MRLSTVIFLVAGVYFVLDVYQGTAANTPTLDSTIGAVDAANPFSPVPVYVLIAALGVIVHMVPELNKQIG